MWSSVMDINFWALIVNSALVISGWFISARWAVKQVNVAHDKNRELQNEIIKQTIKDDLYRDFISLYIDIAESINALNYSITNVGLNMCCDERKPDDRVIFGWRELIDKINENYSALGKQMDKLDILLNASADFLPKADEINVIVKDYRHNFSAENAKCLWIVFQANIAGIRIENKPDTKRYEAVSRPVADALTSLNSKLKESAKMIQRMLVMREAASGRCC